MQSAVGLKSRFSFPIVEITIIIGLYLSRWYSFLLFHCLAELFSIIVACCVFTLGWNVRKLLENGYFLFLGIGYLFISAPDLIHALSYKGMGIFQAFDANLPTQLWLGARFMESLTLMISPFFILRKIKGGYLFHIYLLATTVLLGSIFYADVLPAAFVEDQGLTWFKKISEYVISALLLISLTLLFRHRTHFETNVFRYMVAAIAMTIVSELAFTFYVHVYGLSNLIGHYFKIGSVYFIYKAIVETGLTRPISLLFRNLKEARDELEDRIQERTAELVDANRALTSEIEERRRMARMLKKNMQMLQSLFDGITDPLILLDRDMRIKIINHAAKAYYELDDTTRAIGKRCHEALRKEPSPCEGCAVPRAIEEAQNIGFERPGFMDSTKFESVDIYLLKNPQHHVDDVILRINDMTQRKILEKQIIQNEKMASLGVLVSSIAHEINNPNNFISFNLPILRDYLHELLPVVDKHAEMALNLEFCNLPYAELRDDIPRLLDNIEQGTNRINMLVSSLKDFSRTRKMPHLSWVDLKSTMHKAVNMCQSEIKKTVYDFRLNVPEAMTLVYTDPHSIEQVLINLIVNAAQSADKADSFIHISAAKGSGRTSHTIIEVVDNGCGIPQNQLKHIFDPFYTTKPIGQGTGMGLYVCNNIIEELGGWIKVESNQGQGAKFTVILPDIDPSTKNRITPGPGDQTGKDGPSN